MITTHTRGIRTTLALVGCLFAGAAMQGCSGSGSAGTASPVAGGVHLTAVHYGKIVDVYGLRTIGGSQVIELFQTDMMVGLDIQDERTNSSNKSDDEILYDYISANPDTLQPRLLITREIGSKEFQAAVDDLDENVRLLSPNQFGRDISKAPYTVVPRNAAFRLTFDGQLGFTDDDLYTRDAAGKISGYKNTEAIQLLRITGDPNDKKHEGDFQVLPSRIAIRHNQIFVDPVLLGNEGLIFGNRNSAAGMPESPDQQSANIRLAVALEGPLGIPGIAQDVHGSIRGRNNDGYNSVVRDFRSGNKDDNSPDLARGFLRDPIPPRLVGEMLMYLERVETVNAQTKLLTIFKDGIEHELDRGDILRLFVDRTATPLASLEILRDPADDLGKPERQRVRVLVRPVVDANGTDLLEKYDPSNLPGFPTFAGPARDKFVRENAPRSVLVAEFTYRRLHPGGDPNEPYYGDDPRNFLSFNPNPMANDNGIVVNNENVSPFAGAVIRFSKPIDMNTLIALDTMFFATRNVLDQSEIDAFVKSKGIEPTRFDKDKFRTPHLIHSRIFDENGAQTAIRVQPTLGFYLDKAMRDAAKADKSLPFKQRRYHYFLHLLSGSNGIADLSGNPLDFQAVPVSGLEVADKLVLEFEIETRDDPNSGKPRFDDNLVVYVVRRFASQDEDERPSYYLPGEITPAGANTPADAYPSADFFGPVSYLPSGELIARQGTRVTKVVDNVNQISAPSQSSNLRWCPETVSGQVQVIFQSAATVFGAPIQNPLNPYGCRLVTCWREIDMSLSRTDPQDFNLDVEQLYWAPFAGNAIYFDEFDRVSLFLGHSEFRPETCINTRSAFPTYWDSGLFIVFDGNYAHNLSGPGQVGYKPLPHPAYIDSVLSISAKDAVLDVTGTNRFLPLPKFTDATKLNRKNKYFVWRDEQENLQGGITKIAHDRAQPYPYLLSPWLSGQGRKVTGPPNNLKFEQGGWYNHLPVHLTGSGTDPMTHGLVGTIALPLLADFWTYPDSPQKPVNDPFIASGINGWQISLAVTSTWRPYFRAYSAGRGGGSPIAIGPSHPNWKTARGGYTPTGGSTNATDNSVYWVMADFLKRTAVVTSGFVDIQNPHRMPANGDPRLGPFNTKTAGKIPDYVFDFEPPLSSLPSGTSVTTEFRGASVLDTPAVNVWPKVASNMRNADNFPNDPLKAGDASMRHWDIRGGRAWWTYMYNKTVTRWTAKPNDLSDTNFTNSHSGPKESFEAADVKYFNWRFIMKNNMEVDPPVSPRIESFAVSYRFVPDHNK